MAALARHEIGAGIELAQVALASARERGLRVIPKCTFFSSYMRRHPETQDLLAPEGHALLEQPAPNERQ